MADKPTYEELEKRIKELEQAESERERIEDTSQEHQGQFRLLFERAPLGYQSLDEEGNIIEINPAWLDLLGYSREEVIGKSFGEFLHPDWKNHFKENFPHFKAVGEILGVEFEMVKKDGSHILISFNGKIGKDKHGDFQQTHCILHDITSLKKSEEALIHKTALLEAQLNSSIDGITIVDTQGKKILQNQRTVELWKIPQNIADNDNDEAQVQHVVHMTKNPDQFAKKVAHLYKHPNETSLDEVELTDGTVLDRYSAPVVGKDGQNFGRIWIFRDITKRKQAEEARENLQAQLIQAQKLESIGTLAGGIAHDFNNILSPIMIHTEMAMADLPPESPLQENMEQIYMASKRARDLVRQILTFARQQGKERIEIKISKILKEAIKLLRSTTPTTIDIQVEIKSEQDTILANPTQIYQIIMNLCTNAHHAMENNGGTLEVHLSNENLDFESIKEFPDLTPGRYLKLTVKDTGQGIEPQFMEKIFEPYFTTKKVGKGSGMGLSLVHGIVKTYGGAIAVKSEVGKGTSFFIYFPLIESPSVDLEKAKNFTPLPGGTERILFVDDEKAMVDANQSMLEALGYRVTARTSSIEALEAFRNDPHGFDLVITDMTMPNMTGKDLIKNLMSIRPDIPTILCTGFSEIIDKQKAKAMGAKAFLMKPIIRQDMANTIREVLDSVRENPVRANCFRSGTNNR